LQHFISFYWRLTQLKIWYLFVAPCLKTWP
jgi:hypothetical protein